MRRRLAAIALGFALTGTAHAAPLEVLRDAQLDLRDATRDTVGHADDPARLDALGAALLAVGRADDAAPVFARVLALAPADAAAHAALGRLALHAGRLDEAAAHLAVAGDADTRYLAALRADDWSGAAALAREAGDEGRIPLLEVLAEEGAYRVAPGPGRGQALFVRTWPVPVIRASLNGQRVRLVVDPGLSDLLLDPRAFRVQKVRGVPGERGLLWNGARIAVRNALVQDLEIAGFHVANVPAGTYELHDYSREIVPREPDVDGVVGLELLRRFVPTLDWRGARLELARAGSPVPPGGDRVPFGWWGPGELMVQGTIAGGRRMWLQVGTGLPGAAVGAPADLFEELGVKPGTLSRLVKGAGRYLQGHDWTQVPVATVSIGKLTTDKLHGWVGAYDPGERMRRGIWRDALLGPEAFKDRRVTIDWATQELVFEAP